jgi:hypothetical protein
MLRTRLNVDEVPKFGTTRNAKHYRQIIEYRSLSTNDNDYRIEPYRLIDNQPGWRVRSVCVLSVLNWAIEQDLYLYSVI